MSFVFLLLLKTSSTNNVCKMNGGSYEKIPTVTPVDLHTPSPEMKESVEAVERIVHYDLNNKKLLEEALTHPSFRASDAVSYQRLAFLGDAVLGLAVSNYLFHVYPGIDQGGLTELRSANVSKERFARVAVRHGLYTYVRRTATAALDDQVREFTEVVSREEEKTPVYGGSVEASRVLAEIVESLAGAIYVDLNFDLEKLWKIFRHVLETIVTIEELQQQPHPVTKLHQFCQKHGKLAKIECERDETKSTANVYVDGMFVASGSSEQKKIAEVSAAEMALCNLMQSMCTNDASVEDAAGIDGSFPVERAKNELHNLCAKKKWPKPIYTR
ncbi:ribonuclease 3-like protein 2 isoform X2 [Rosa chinensis]|uniref:ribonuclease 3-like protein 2 isoform X2 n=1 Tax=Rosa chinensis TaxID=74649 RepID=UPI000D091623|nr:ribonuclease 3-like protein 2 isoform X2 [Rosa chinensis]